jgi:hypothetical protein
VRNVVILGCARSGTSILGELFELLPCYGYLFEFDVEEVLSGSAARPWAAKNPTLFRDTEDEAIATRTPGLACEIGVVRDVLDPVVLWIVRNPLDATASMLKGMKTGWGHGPRPDDWADFIDGDPLLKGARQWQWVNGEGFPRASPDHVVRYEDLLSDPEKVLRDVCRIVEAPVLECVIETWSKMVADPDYEARYQVRWKVPHERGRWNALTPDQQTVVRDFLGSLPADFGYYY